jgi:hypothetical protein
MFLFRKKIFAMIAQGCAAVQNRAITVGATG